MTTRYKIAWIFVALFICFGGIWTYKLIWGKPTRFNLFVERVFIEGALEDPELLTALGFDFKNGQLTDISPSRNASSLQQIRNWLDLLHEYRSDRLDHQEKCTYDILQQYLQSILAEASFGFGSYVSSNFTPYPVNQVFGMQSYLPDFMVSMHQVINKKSAKNYIARLSQWGKKFTDLIADLKLREKNGVVPPSFVIEKVLHELQQFIHVSPRENLLFTSFQGKLQKVELSISEREDLERGVQREIETKVYPAYSELIAFLQKQLAVATRDAGVWKFPRGQEYYVQCLKYQTTTDDSPDEVHTFGLSEVKRIKEELKRLFDPLGYQGQEVIDAMKALGSDPQFLYPDTDEGRRAILEDYRALVEDTKGKLPQVFSEFPKAELKIEPVPAFYAKTAPMAYYQPGDLKGKRPGVFFVNTQNLKSHPKFTMPTLTYHEGIPGHHFQISLAQEIKNLPTFRKIVPFNAYLEGWALYCEQLGFEYGFNTDPYCNIGRLQFELMRSVRLVVDTGMHWKKWTREEAIEYMVENTGMDKEEVVVEIERYIVLPAQACSYKIGMRKILQLREEMKQRLGDNFDIKIFHQKILQNGAMPLTLLQTQ